MKKILIIGTAIVLLVIPGAKILAEEKLLKGEGNINGSILFYNEDIEYLKKEINELLRECNGGLDYE